MRFKEKKQYRLPYYNYASSGLYFVTICAKNREIIFGDISNGVMKLSKNGSLILECLNNLPKKLSYLLIDEFVIMPNHIHVIFVINNPDEKREIDKKKFQIKKKSLSLVVRNFKSTVTLLSRKIESDVEIWQSRFYDRIIRNEKELIAIRNYIANNPEQWEEDKNNLDNLMM